MLINQLLGRARRAIALVTGAALLMGPFGPAAFAAPTKLSDIPIAAKVTAKPNIVYTVDDSGSMNYTYLPDYAVASATLLTVNTITRIGATATVTTAAAHNLSTNDWVIISGFNEPEYNGQFQITVTGASTFTITVAGAPATPGTGATKRYTTATQYCRSGNGTAPCTAVAVFNTNPFSPPPILAAEFNALAYNPDVDYTPPRKYDGTPWTYSVGTVTDALGNQQYTKAQEDPFLSPGTQRNLTATVAVPVYCNTDWPLIAGASIARADVGDSVNAEYMAGTGAWCRINGTRYDLSAASGAPAVNDDYNYPYQRTNGVNDPKYFYRQLSVKTLWCDTTSPYWPRTTSGGTCTTTCNIATTTATQTCNAGSNINTCCTGVGAPVAGCTGASSYTPASCYPPAKPLYCSPNGTGSSPECLGCTCNLQVTGRNGSCSITGANCSCSGNGCTIIVNGNPACPDQLNYCPPGNRTTTCTGPAGSAACDAQLYNPVTKLYDLGTTLLQDSNGLGRVCRHNNQTYATGGAAGLFKYPGNYPGEGAGTGNFNTQVTTNCPAVGTTVAIPRHYYTVDSLQFCDQLITTANDPWRGFGTGACQAKNDLSQFKNVKYGKFTRVALVSGRTYNYIDQLTGAPATRSYAQETVNYANWYAYYRSRILATKTTSSLAFSYLDDTYRVGFHNLGQEPPPAGPSPLIPTIWQNVNDFTYGAGNQRDQWYTKLFGIAPTNFKTPLISAMQRVGHLFETGGAGGLPPEVNPLSGVVTDPITLSCQSNYHILFTDGTTNQVNWPTVAGNKDSTVPAWAGIADIPPDQVLPNLRPASGLPWPAPFREKGTFPMGDSLADVGTYYWSRDLRPGLKNDVPAEPGKGTGDLDSTKDVAWWQHVNFNAISFGGEGMLDAVDQKATLSALTAGTKSWTETLNSTLNAARPFSPQNPTGNPGASAVDDLWHAAVNGRGKFVYARSPLEVSYGLASILAGIQNSRKSRVGAAITGQVIAAGVNDVIYESTIERGWAGDLLKVRINPANGAELATLWQAGPVIASQVDPVATAQPEPWFTNRRVVTLDTSGTRVAFRHPLDPNPPGSLDATQLATFAAAGNPLLQRKVVAYLRGASTFQVNALPAPATVIEGTSIGQFRKRFGILGDITNAQPVAVGKPNRPYKDTTNPGYSAYKAAQAARPMRIFAPANDGMVHVIDDATGEEVYAYVPRDIIRSGPTGMNALTYQDGGVPIYKHKFFVDSSPKAADVDFSGGLGTGWRTIVVGGLGKGGKTYYALDATGATAADETAAANKILWEWADPDNDLVYSYGRPVIVKTRAWGGRWMVIVTSGYNNVSGEGRVHFIDAETGIRQAKLTTPTTSCAAGPNAGQPTGLTFIHAYVADQTNQVADQIYGGDLCGNLWRWDIRNPNPAAWSATRTIFAQVTDPGGVPQPITTAPQIEIDYNNAIDRYVFIGTGRLLDISDLGDTQVQTFYAIRDGTAANPSVVGLPMTRGALKPINPDGVSAIAGGAPNGWYHDVDTLPGAFATDPTCPACGPPPATVAGRRIVVDVQADVNVASYIVTEPQTDPCVIALPAALVAREYSTAESLLSSGGSAVGSVPFSQGAVAAPIIGRTQADGSYSLGALVSLEVPGSAPIDIRNPVVGSVHRLSWRLLTGN